MALHDQPQEPNAIPPPVALLQLVTGYWVSQAIYVAAKLGLADLLRDGGPRVVASWRRPRQPTPGRSLGCCAPSPVSACSQRSRATASG